MGEICAQKLCIDKTQTGAPSIVFILLFLHNGELTLHYFLTVECGFVQWAVRKEQKGICQSSSIQDIQY